MILLEILTGLLIGSIVGWVVVTSLCKIHKNRKQKQEKDLQDIEDLLKIFRLVEDKLTQDKSLKALKKLRHDYKVNLMMFGHNSFITYVTLLELMKIEDGDIK